MSFSPIPDWSFRSLTDIRPEFLKKEGVSFLMLDLDNTISPYGTSIPNGEFFAWADVMRRAGITLFIVSNNKTDRPKEFADMLGIGWEKLAGKPGTKGVFRALEAAGKTPEESALAGDQIYTDVLAANSSGVRSILVEPIFLSNAFYHVRYWAELPFRVMAKRKFFKK